jgi:hypothetical protein
MANENWTCRIELLITMMVNMEHPGVWHSIRDGSMKARIDGIPVALTELERTPKLTAYRTSISCASHAAIGDYVDVELRYTRVEPDDFDGHETECLVEKSFRVDLPEEYCEVIQLCADVFI